MYWDDCWLFSRVITLVEIKRRIDAEFDCSQRNCVEVNEVDLINPKFQLNLSTLEKTEANYPMYRFELDLWHQKLSIRS